MADVVLGARAAMPAPHLAANALILLVVAGAGLLHSTNPDLYYQHVQEDQPLEWVTFWAFMVAAYVYARAAVTERRMQRFPWFWVGVSAFCFIVAMEEISWGQRLFGYEPPRYFLQNNYQQELNVHNVMAKGVRKLAVALVLGGFGLLLPLARRLRATAGLFDKLGLRAPPAALAPSFCTLLILYVTYPWRYTGEIVELGMALGFLFAALGAFFREEGPAGRLSRWTPLAASIGVVLVLGFASASWSRGQLADDPVVAEVTATEIRALQRDVEDVMGQAKRPCGLHERLTHFASRKEGQSLVNGRFQDMKARGLPEERAEFFIDPWSTAYWVRTTCNDARDKIFLYSFGPNRRRDSSRWALQGDDIGVVFRVRHDRGRPKVARVD